MAEYMNTKEVAAYLDINEKQVYALIKTGGIPCTRVTGKWVFTRTLIDRWIEINSIRGNTDLTADIKKPLGAIFAAGSNDPVLDILINSMKHGESAPYIFSAVTGSTEGLRLLGTGLTDIAWCHLADPETGEYNIDSIRQQMDGKKIAIVHLFNRQAGFISKGPGPINTSFSEVRDKKLRFINRQKGSGTRILTDHFLQSEGIFPGLIAGYEDEVFSHLEVGLKIVSGGAETGVATSAVAKILGLAFYPLINESFDMVLSHDTFFNSYVQDFIETLGSASFRSMVSHLGNYDFGRSGRIIYSTKE